MQRGRTQFVIGLPGRIDSIIISINTLETETVDLIDTFDNIDMLDNGHLGDLFTVGCSSGFGSRCLALPWELPTKQGER